MVKAYMGAFGMVRDGAERLFNLLVRRGERVETDVRQVVKDARKEQTKVTAKAQKAVKKAAKRARAVA